MKDSLAARISILGVGFIGRNLLNSYVGSGHDIRVLDRKPCPDEFCKNVHWTQGSLEELNKVHHVIKGADVVFHLISSTQTINLLKLCVEENVQRIVFISSASVYGIKHDLPISETASTDPISSHGIHKLTIEKYLQLYKYKYGLDSKIMRLSNPYGWGQDVFGRQGLISITVGKILTGDPILIMGDGSAIRDFVYIDDVVEATVRSINYPGQFVGALNVGSGEAISVMTVAQEIKAFFNSESTIGVTGAFRLGDIRHNIADMAKLDKVLDFVPGVPFKQGLANFLGWAAGQAPEDKAAYLRSVCELEEMGLMGSSSAA